jgi:hypothetical protein
LQIIKLVVLANFIGRKESIIKDNGKTIKWMVNYIDIFN